MQCARIVDAFKPLEVTTLPIPELPDEGMLIKTLYAGICHSDIHFIDDEMDLGDGKVFKNRDLLGK
jgi:propanol-preferring alcohol dehydrogenase